MSEDNETIEQELLRISEFQPAKKYKNRQDYLHALVLAVTEISDKDFESLSDQAADWYNDAVKARNKKKPIADLESSEEAAEPTEEVEGTPDEEKPSEEEVNGKPDKPAKKAATAAKRTPPKPNDGAPRNRYGVVEGTKTAHAISMYEKGTTSRELKDKLGGTHYNILARLAKEGHRVEKGEGGVVTLTHKDDVGKGKAKTKKG